MSSAGLTRALARKEFRRLFLGITLSRIGDTMTFTVVAWLALDAGGPAAVGQNVAVPVLVEDDELTAANTLLASSWDTAAWLGPAAAGLALARLGAGPVLVLDAVTFLATAAIALTLPDRGDRSPERSGILGGFRVLLGLRPVLVITLVAVGNLFLGGMVEVFLPAFTGLTLHAGPARYGLLVSIAGLTGLVGTLVLTPLVDRLRPGPALVLVLAARGLALLPLAAVGSWAVAAVVVAVAAMPDGPFFPISRTVQQRLIPAPVAGRVQGARSALGVVGFPLGAAVGGAAVAALGAGPTAVLMAAGYAALAVAVLATPSVLRLSTVDARAGAAADSGAGAAVDVRAGAAAAGR